MMHKKTAELLKVSNTKAKELFATGEWKYIDKSTFQRKLVALEDVPGYEEKVIPYEGGADDTADPV